MPKEACSVNAAVVVVLFEGVVGTHKLDLHLDQLGHVCNHACFLVSF